MRHDELQLRGETLPQRPVPSLSVREVVAILYRRKFLIMALFLAIFLTIAAVTMLIPATYVAHAQILLKQERASTVVSPRPEAKAVVQPRVSQETLNSEIEILRSASLLRKVVRDTGMARRILGSSGPEPSDGQRLIEVAVSHLKSDLEVAPVPKSNIIHLSYESHDPHLAAEIVNDLCRRYVDRHLEVHETRGIQTFFKKQAESLADSLRILAAALRRFENEHDLIDPAQQRQVLLQQLADYENKLSEVRASAEAATQQANYLNRRLAEMPEQISTQAQRAQRFVLAGLRRELDSLKTEHDRLMRTGPNAASQYNESKRQQVHSIKSQIARVEEAILQEEKAQRPEVGAEISRSLSSLSTDLTRARFEEIGFRTREKELTTVVDALKTRLQQLEQAALTHEALKRRWQLYHENYLLYSRKQEEARISEALDREKVTNVSVIDPATVPLRAARPNRKMNLAIGLFLALVVSFGTAFGLGHFDRVIRSRGDIERRLNVPVIASIPEGQWLPKLLPDGNHQHGSDPAQS